MEYIREVKDVIRVMRRILDEKYTPKVGDFVLLVKPQDSKNWVPQMDDYNNMVAEITLCGNGYVEADIDNGRWAFNYSHITKHFELYEIQR